MIQGLSLDQYFVPNCSLANQIRSTVWVFLLYSGKPVFGQPNTECGCEEYVPETSVFDTWATSSITPQIIERLGLKRTPMSMRTHAHEIIRTWTFYTIVRSLYHTGTIPWKDVMICGFVLAKKGKKIIDLDLLGFGEQVKEIIFEMRKHKSERNLSMRALG